LPDFDAIDQIAELVAKSLIVSELKAAQPRFRLSNITRAYALEKLRESGELDATVRLVECLRANVTRVSAVDTLSGALSAFTSSCRSDPLPPTLAIARIRRRANYHWSAEPFEGSHYCSDET
jgi:hypothetical protein